MSLLLRLAAGALALPLIGDEEADKLQTYNDLLGNRSRNQGLNRCVAWMATAKRVDRMKRRDVLPRVPGRVADFVSCGVPKKHSPCARSGRIKPQTSDPLLFPEQSIG